ncbi:Lsr2 family DNA-binding protein [Streptacidiphilus neutrinimicus]|uniref:Lsr2 family DNA-binding protein n=1 Tax=Streptacidiphilus neutrinimicus TaxID=105420 RepID=UPI0005A832A8|nr:histone-like nucleoid-structuring protein Lsr2 [Streptacidiphilus neutrinimicus]
MPTDAAGHTLAALVAAAESLDLSNEPTSDDLAAASRAITGRARDKDDLVRLLEALDLPHDEDDLVPLLTLLSPAPGLMPGTADQEGPNPMTNDAYTATAVSMYADRRPLDEITTMTGVTETELAQALAEQMPDTPVIALPGDLADLSCIDAMTRSVALSMYYADDDYTTEQITEATGLTTAQIGALVDECEQQIDTELSARGIEAATVSPTAETTEPDAAGHGRDEQLLAWAEQHTHPCIRDLAGQARAALDELARLRGTEHDRAQAQTEVDRLRAALADAEQRLHALQPAPAASPARLASVPAPRTTGKRAATAGRIEQPADKRVRQAIRAWANEHGHTVAPQGLISQDVLRAYTNAHQPGLAKAG